MIKQTAASVLPSIPLTSALSGWRQRLFCLLLVLALPFPVAQAEEEVTPQQLKDLQSRIKDLQLSRSQVADRRSRLEDELRVTEKNIAAKSSQIISNLKDSENLQRKIERYKVQQRDLKRKQVQQQGYLEKQIRSAYAMGRQEYLKVLLNQQSPDQVSRVLRYYDYINKERSRHIDQYMSTTRELVQLEKSIVQQKYALGELRRKLETDRDQLKKEQQQRERLVAELNQDLQSKDQELAELERDRKRLERLLAEVEQAIVNLPMPKDTRPFKSMRGKLPWPVKGRVAYAFGSEQIRGKLRRNGMVIRANEGREVKAIHSGRVVFADWLRGYGVLLILDHGNGYMSLYGHNQSLLREAGDWIQAGETIATAGRSGGQSRSGLYFEIREKGNPRDPIVWLSRR